MVISHYHQLIYFLTGNKSAITKFLNCIVHIQAAMCVHIITVFVCTYYRMDTDLKKNFFQGNFVLL